MEEDDVHLSVEALMALQELAREQMMSNNVAESFPDENWELSQFWYDDETSEVLAKAAIEAVGNTAEKRIACVSSPSIYHKLKNICPNSQEIYLFEYDKRFKDKYPDSFIFYDYKDCLDIDDKFKSYFDIVLADPPFLSEECLEKFSKTISMLTDHKIVLCTGAVMKDLAEKLLQVSPCSFIPKHKRNLGNEFKCYTNFNFDEYITKVSFEKNKNR